MELIERLEALQATADAATLAFDASRQNTRKADAWIDSMMTCNAAIVEAFPELAAHIKAQAAEIVNLKQCLYDETEGITATLRNDRIAELEAALKEQGK